MRFVYILTHSYEDGNDKQIGVYTSKEKAEEALERVRAQPGFRDWPTGFFIDECELNKDNWDDGFVKLIPIHIKFNGNNHTLWHCILAEKRPNNLFLIPEVEDEVSRKLVFSSGQLVRCEEKEINGIPGCLAAVEAIE